MKYNALFLLSLFALLISPSFAQQSETPAPYSGDYISVSVGYYDVTDDDGAIDLRAEYRPNHTYFNLIKPWAGIEITSDSSLWIGGGALIDYEFTPNWYVIPSFGAGLYARGSSDKDLDYPMQFRSQLEIAHQYESGHRAGLALSHLSNADLGDENPGTEILSAYWHIPY